MKSKPQAEFTIRQVIELSGVSEFTLRGWEGRYKAIKPKRTATGRRVYLKEDVLKISSMMKLVKMGHRIGQIANLNLQQLQDLLAETPSTILKTPAQTPDPKLTKQNSEICELLKQVEKYNWAHVTKTLERIRFKTNSVLFIKKFLVELQSQINLRIAQNRLSIAQEHILSSLIKESLNVTKALARKRKNPSSAKLVIATPEGDYHELGILMASTLATAIGLDNLYLGPNVPKRDLTETCLRFGATHLLVSTTVSKAYGAKDDFLSFVSFLDRQLEPNVSLWMAGPNTNEIKTNLNRDHLILSNMDDFYQKLKPLTSKAKGKYE